LLLLTSRTDSGGAGYYKNASDNFIIAGLVADGDTNCISTARNVRVDVGVNLEFIQCILEKANGEGDYDECAIPAV
jgi:hypothetical protein